MHKATLIFWADILNNILYQQGPHNLLLTIQSVFESYFDVDQWPRQIKESRLVPLSPIMEWTSGVCIIHWKSLSRVMITSCQIKWDQNLQCQLTCQAESIHCRMLKYSFTSQQQGSHWHRADALTTNTRKCLVWPEVTGGVVTGTICLEEISQDDHQPRGHRILETILWTPERRGWHGRSNNKEYKDHLTIY